MFLHELMASAPGGVLAPPWRDVGEYSMLEQGMHRD